MRKIKNDDIILIEDLNIQSDYRYCVGPNRRLIDMLNSGDIDSINLAISIIENG